MESLKKQDVQDIVVEEKRHHLEDKAESRLKILFQGPFLQHGRLVHGAECLRGDNSWSPTTDRFWSISPQTGNQTKLAETIAIVMWVLFVIYPGVAIPVGCCLRNICNIVNAVILSVIIAYFLTCFYIILKNKKKFRRLWFVIKTNEETCKGYRNQVTLVTRENVQCLSFMTLHKKREVDLKLAQNPHKVAVIMQCSRSFWNVHILDPIFCLIGLILLYTGAVIIQIEMLQTSLL
ncbi:uncharacterized protein LOC121375606 [Gigantopelta aegis]|uniref:uncharacterized protein LOC121375606 n=1 Tax=Gigantopelta aegis TaxID=1735272 RepID=UPI001B88DDD8|nr:uncharacterized protein LOC121375606 [Gigantopelta aegis]XP_041359082.1 uncharacterized protein LOC121375606 [Gigantopelta aegis]